MLSNHQLKSSLHHCSTGLRAGKHEGHSIEFTSFSYSSNHPVIPAGLWKGVEPSFIFHNGMKDFVLY